MDSTEFEPGEPGRDVPVARQRAGTPKNRKHPLTGPQRMPEENIEKTLDTTNKTGKSWQRSLSYSSARTAVRALPEFRGLVSGRVPLEGL